jgi:hypothetical protein
MPSAARRNHPHCQVLRASMTRKQEQVRDWNQVNIDAGIDLSSATRTQPGGVAIHD